MRQLKLSFRYAKALFDLALEQKTIDKIKDDMLLVDATIRASRELKLVFNSPVIKPDKKLSIFKEIFGANISKETILFYQLIIKKNRESCIHEIAEGYIKLYKEHKGIKTAKMQTTIALNPEAKKKIISLLEEQTKSKIELEERINKEIVGGFILTIDDMLFDSSIKHHLSELKQEFSKNPYVKEY